MTMTATPIFPQTFRSYLLDIENADGTALQTLVTAHAENGSRVEKLTVTSDDTSSVTLKFWLGNGSVDVLVGSVTVPTLSGTNGSAPAIDVLDVLEFAYDPGSGGKYITLQAGWTLKVSAAVAVTSAKKVTVTGFGVDF